ncbi:Predicted arabinose efflux permease, MFS family [Amycolatopsis pretoriensis]|uniref:Predicted arabinose efflux permease, MFS family n=1 Tax=Amycolatopsis pretoriensis TaxID=218821 RepID=A0A1H5QIK4_9PSEU|nr:MFS transporter [Amycolatopsis pretoriensis]SEF25983.1 Predicted arabinose efflux permease, MFS family [Amycolatopsis pretoriensis]
MTSTEVRRQTPALLALTTAAFVTVLTEALPAGVLPGMSAGLGVGESAAGQAVTVYALGTALTAIPLAAATAAWSRKRLLLAGVAGFAVANTVTALSANYPVTMVARFVAGVAAGVVWALLAGYARRLAPENQGKAIALVMAGIPLALSLGIPAGTFLGGLLGWRSAFGVMSAIAVALLPWIVLKVPDQPGRTGARTPVLRTLAVPGVAPVLAVTLVFVLAHTVLYTYVAAFLGHAGMGDAVDVVLLVFGIASMAGIWVVGARIDRALRTLTVLSTILVGVAATILATASGSPALVYAAVTLWGLGWGGVPTLLQTAAGNAGGDAADNAQAMLVTLWNAAMAAGGVLGGVLLDAAGPASFPWTLLLLLLPVLAVVLGARRHGFPAAS